MPRYNVIFESEEEIYGIVPRAYDRVHYKSIPKVKDGGKHHRCLCEISSIFQQLRD
jgi:hypothetical protein